MDISYINKMKKSLWRHLLPPQSKRPILVVASIQDTKLNYGKLNIMSIYFIKIQTYSAKSTDKKVDRNFSLYLESKYFHKYNTWKVEDCSITARGDTARRGKSPGNLTLESNMKSLLRFIEAFHCIDWLAKSSSASELRVVKNLANPKLHSTRLKWLYPVDSGLGFKCIWSYLG